MAKSRIFYIFTLREKTKKKDLKKFLQNEGLVVNAAISLYVHVYLMPGPDQDISLYAVDLKQLFHPCEVSASLHGVNLPQAVLSRIRPNMGCHLVTWSDAPKGSGLGTSGALGVALVSLLSMSTEKHKPYQTVDLANAIEREIGIPCGKQDHYASLLGGVNFLRCQGESVKATPIQFAEKTLEKLHNSLILVYTGESHFSGEILQNVIDAYKAGNQETHGALAALRRVANEMKQTLAAGDPSRLGQLLDENWHFQKRLHPSVNTKRISELFDIAKKSGCSGGKACGAGGGGCLLFHCESDRIVSATRALREVGARVIPFRFDFEGFCIHSPCRDCVRNPRQNPILKTLDVPRNSTGIV